jgi:hypothetical protein
MGDLFEGEVADVGLGQPGIDAPLAFLQGSLYQRQAGRFAVDGVERASCALACAGATH